MDMLNSIHVIVSNTFCKLAIWNRPEATAAVGLGYGYDINEDDE